MLGLLPLWFSSSDGGSGNSTRDRSGVRGAQPLEPKMSDPTGEVCDMELSDQPAERAATPPIPGSLANPGINPESAATMRETGIAYHFASSARSPAS